MYLPYLRGKQFELLALKSFSQNNPNCSSIIPIIEPVKINTKALEIAFNAMMENQLRFTVILNPREGDFKHPINNDILSFVPSLNEKLDNWIPAYIYNKNGNRIIGHSNHYELNDLMIIFNQSIDFNDPDINELLLNTKVRYVIINNSSRATKSKLRNIGKNIISLEDRFKVRQKNADYLNPDDEFYSDDFAFFQEENLWGYSDYTTIGKDFIEGGMLPYAIAIHLTYQKSDNEINVHHFVSDNNYDQSNIKGKFLEAARKIAPFFEEKGLVHTKAVNELIEKSLSYDSYPGLGYLKKLSILNHLELIKRLTD